MGQTEHATCVLYQGAEDNGCNNLAFLGLGLPIGMVIGIALGSSKDQEALKKGLQLDIEYF